MSIIEKIANVGHARIAAIFDQSLKSFNASTAALYDKPGRWTASGPPVSDEDRVTDGAYTAQARIEAERKGGGS